mmetsp:Transcript_13078/g.36191  ORF Transcript_13078/g.36191 Transcript_13078/m.36191 type:complete len:850 (+) Transcript_13078:53-2602(+)
MMMMIVRVQHILLSVILLILLLHVDPVTSQTGGGGTSTCSGQPTRFSAPSESTCLPWANQRGQDKTYPDDFGGILNQVEIYQCPSRNKRVIISNGIPDHDVTLQNPLAPCQTNWAVEMPLQPQVAASQTEIPIRGMVAMALNGVPAYGPQESDDANAVDGADSVPGAKFWYGHTGGNLVWHFHNPQMGQETVAPTTLLGYAMDGFPLYGPLADADVGQLDACNGMVNSDGNYVYHVRAIHQVDPDVDYCNGNSPETNWNYILGCYSGSVAQSAVFDSSSYILDNDCVLDPNPVFDSDDDDDDGDGNDEPTRTGVNIIVMQPDDLLFFDEWGAPPNSPTRPNQNTNLPDSGLPHLHRLRTEGAQLLQAYAASSTCGTSRYTTLTGKYASRAESNDSGSNLPLEVTIPTTKLMGDDCATQNLAAEFQANGYRTAMIGKWHLSNIRKNTYSYEGAVDTVKQCGFTSVGGLYIENLASSDDGFNNYSDGTFSHNMEWITDEAIKVINEDSYEPFFMYFNPTVPHASNSIEDALNQFSCRDTADGMLPTEPVIPGMTKEYGSCTAYRQSVIARSNGVDDYGPIWLDDAVGALLKALETKGILDNTIFLFQEDHGMDVKGAIVEGGVRIPQFVHYPAKINAGTQLNVPVSTIDVAATMLDFAGITPSYNLDGMSWKKALESDSQRDFFKDGRCLFFEIEQDRAARCGCYKYLTINDPNDSTTYSRGGAQGLSVQPANLFDLCGGTSEYITDKATNQEAANLLAIEPTKAAELLVALECHLDRTDGSGADFPACNLFDPPAPETDGPTASPVAAGTPSPTAEDETRGPSGSPTKGKFSLSVSFMFWALVAAWFSVL